MSERELLADERAVLDFLLSAPFPGLDQLRGQLAYVRVEGLSCQCGCPSIDLQVDRRAAPADAGRAIDAYGRDAEGNIVLVGLRLREGYMSELDFTDIAATSGTGGGGTADRELAAVGSGVGDWRPDRLDPAALTYVPWDVAN